MLTFIALSQANSSLFSQSIQTDKSMFGVALGAAVLEGNHSPKPLGRSAVSPASLGSLQRETKARHTSKVNREEDFGVGFCQSSDLCGKGINVLEEMRNVSSRIYKYV